MTASETVVASCFFDSRAFSSKVVAISGCGGLSGCMPERIPPGEEPAALPAASAALAAASFLATRGSTFLVQCIVLASAARDVPLAASRGVPRGVVPLAVSRGVALRSSRGVMKRGR